MQGLNAPSGRCGAEQTATEAAVFPSLSGFSPIQANDALRLDCRNAKPNPAEPSNIVAQVDGSGTAEVSVDILPSSTSASQGCEGEVVELV
jgi:hypothetical protein